MNRIPWVGVSGVLAAVLVFAGCATSGGPSASSDEKATGTQHEVPPEVTDHTVDERPAFARTSRPVVDVSMDKGELLGVDAASYETSVRRNAQQCYSRTIRVQESEIEGSMVYEVLVTRNGRVAGTDVVSSGLDSDGIRSCVEQVLGRLTFDVAVRNRPVFRLFFRLDFQLETLVPSEPPV